MQIANIEVIPARIPLKAERRMISALGRHDESRFVLVRLTTTDGATGVGEATVTPSWSGETVWGAVAMLREVLAPAVTGCDVQDIAEISRRMDSVAVGNWFAKSAIDMACHDAWGRTVSKPVFELLGGAVRPLTIRNRFSMGAYEPDVAAERAVERVAAGFQTIKIKVGTGNEADIARVCAVREAVGSQIELTIDANGGWSDADARLCLPKILSHNIAFVEQPLQRGNYTQLKQLRDDFDLRILADESCFDEIHLRELIQHQCCDAVTLYPGKQGGIARAVRLASIADQHRIPCTIGSNLEWDVGAAAMMHFVVATKNVTIESIPGDCLGPAYHEFSIAKNPLRIDGAFTTLGNEPGLGVDVDWELVEQHRLSNAT